MDIFTFWEPQNNMPAYLKLCIKTWNKFIPNAQIHILDSSNILNYINIAPFGKRLFSGEFSLPQIADAIRAQLLQKYGGLWMDVDTVIINNDIEKYLRSDKDVTFFGFPEEQSPRICWINAKPKAHLLNYWYVTCLEKIAEFSSEKVNNNFWSYLGNSIVDPYVRRYPNEIETIDIIKENCMPEMKFGGNNPQNYIKYYFNTEYHLTDVSSTMLLLHNSWTPTEIRKMSEEEFLNCKFTLSNILAEALEL